MLTMVAERKGVTTSAPPPCAFAGRALEDLAQIHAGGGKLNRWVSTAGAVTAIRPAAVELAAAGAVLHVYLPPGDGARQALLALLVAGLAVIVEPIGEVDRKVVAVRFIGK
ncbi:MAG: hypothetical protein MI924_37680 [Chloroflexales bacterium]|nr:hypothetical protein [Chloroflexales bacterium]